MKQLMYEIDKNTTLSFKIMKRSVIITKNKTINDGNNKNQTLEINNINLDDISVIQYNKGVSIINGKTNFVPIIIGIILFILSIFFFYDKTINFIGGILIFVGLLSFVFGFATSKPSQVSSTYKLEIFNRNNLKLYSVNLDLSIEGAEKLIKNIKKELIELPKENVE